MDKIEVFGLTAIALVLLALAVTVVDVAWHHYKDSHVTEDISKGWEPPVIPSCDQELWDRIKDRCGEQLDEGED